MNAPWRAGMHTAFALALFATGGCDMVDTYRRCGSGCPGDAAVTASIEQLLARRGDVWSTDISVQTLDHVVYLRGLVDTDLQREEIVAAAQRVTGVRRVVDSIAIRTDAGF